jgi:O-antigen ligase
MTYAFSLAFSAHTVRISAAILSIVLFLNIKTLLTKHDRDIKYLTISFIIFIIFCLLSFLWNNAELSNTFEYIRKFWYLIPTITIYIYLKKEFYNKVLLSFIFGFILSSIIFYGNYLSLWSIGGGVPSNPTVFSHHTHYSVILAIAIVALIINLLFEKNKKIKILYFIFFLFLMSVLFINLGRTGQVSLFITLLGLTLYYLKSKLKYLILLFLSIVVFLFLNYKYNEKFKERIELGKSDLIEAYYNNKYDTSLGGRIGFYIIAKEILLENPENFFLGVGAKQHIKPVNEIVDNKYPYLFYNKDLPHYHSIFLETITQFGLIGLLLLIAVFYFLAKIEITELKVKLIYFSTLSIYLLSCLVELSIYKGTPLSVFALILGISFAMKTKNIN